MNNKHIHKLGHASVLAVLLLSILFGLLAAPGAFGADKVTVGPRKSATEASGSASEVILVYENDKVNTVSGNGTVTPVYSPRVEVVTAANTISATETGTIFFLNSATEFASVLPAPAAGLEFTFIVAAAPSGASYTITTASSANIFKSQASIAANAAGDTGTADDTISFVDAHAVPGDKVYLVSDGTSWFVNGHAAVAAGLTFTQAN